MQNNDKKEWALSDPELYAVKWLEDRGYAVTIEKRYLPKDHMTAEKDGYKMDFELPLGDPKIRYSKVMEQVESDFIMQKTIDDILNHR